MDRYAKLEEALLALLLGYRGGEDSARGPRGQAAALDGEVLDPDGAGVRAGAQG